MNQDTQNQKSQKNEKGIGGRRLINKWYNTRRQISRLLGRAPYELTIERLLDDFEKSLLKYVGREDRAKRSIPADLGGFLHEYYRAWHGAPPDHGQRSLYVAARSLLRSGISIETYLNETNMTMSLSEYFLWKQKRGMNHEQSAEDDTDHRKPTPGGLLDV